MTFENSLGQRNAEEGSSYRGGTSAEPQRRLALVLLGALTFFWGFNWPMMKIALTEIPPWTFRSLCLALGGLSILCLAKMKGLPLSIPKQEVKPLLLAAFFNVTGWYLCSAYGLFYLKAGRAVILGFTMPLWAAILGKFVLHERLTSERLVGLGLGLAGLMILIWPDLKTIGASPFYSLFMLGAAISWATGIITMKYFHWTMPLVVLTGWQLMLGGIPVIGGAFLFEPITTFSQLSLKAIFATAYVILLAIIFSQWAWFKVVILLPASVASIGTLAVPVVGVFSSALILGEPIRVMEMIALVLVVAGLACVMLRS